ncbi:DUF5333 domain-containing protein [Frigidibacter sp. ROC022]|uniref:DUF5333 domain-containing protein n=1 Tax=Frigidibacter sp. ROC022 TaxID=2971796 RepID=UPI00215A486F|nr:DUF5333 domain-containing protein [Frigidibacter sp. ROC022]MCR8723280.1 DUF5333 domain-containing protein [Frigidibacter sp. ROC022]
MNSNPSRAFVPRATRLVAAALVLAVGATAAAWALPPLMDNKRVMGELVDGEVAYQIQKHCPTISARKLVAFSRLKKLAAYARSLGYTDADFKALTKDGAARDKRDALVDAYLASKGVVQGDAESYCRLGRAEIAAKTLTGSLLYQK